MGVSGHLRLRTMARKRRNSLRRAWGELPGVRTDDVRETQTRRGAIENTCRVVDEALQIEHVLLQAANIPANRLRARSCATARPSTPNRKNIIGTSSSVKAGNGRFSCLEPATWQTLRRDHPLSAQRNIGRQNKTRPFGARRDFSHGPERCAAMRSSLSSIPLLSEHQSMNFLRTCVSFRGRLNRSQ